MFERIGYMLDISRCRVPTMSHLESLVGLLARLGYNELQLYTEHTFAYREHAEVWRGASPMTAEEVVRLDRICKSAGIDLVPNQNSFGHMERWLKHPGYRHLAECPDGFTREEVGRRSSGTTLAPTEESLRFMDRLYEELLPCFTSDFFNVGGDEPWELGQGVSAARIAAVGKSAVYLDYMNRISELVRKRGRRMQMWADILFEDPASLSKLGDDVIPMIWGYEANHPYEDQCAAIAELGLTFYVVPGDSSWNSFHGRLTTMLANQELAAKTGRLHGAYGFLVTQWGDCGHAQTWPITLPGLINGAYVARHGKSLSRSELVEKLTDPEVGGLARATAEVLVEFADCDAQFFSGARPNQSFLRNEIYATKEFLERNQPQAAEETLAACEEWLAGLLGRLPESKGPLEEEIVLMIELSLIACANGKDRLKRDIPSPLLESYRRCWLRRSRPGGLEESVARLNGTYAGD